VPGTGAEGTTAAPAAGRLQVKTGPVELIWISHWSKGMRFMNEQLESHYSATVFCDLACYSAL
jgi:hypothetical protein